MSITIYSRYHHERLHVLDVNTLNRANLQGLRLAVANLSNIQMQGCNLSGANLPGAELISSNLHGANLCHAYLHDADFSFSDLRGADLTGTYLPDTCLHGALLKGAKYGDNRLDKLIHISGVAEHGTIMFYTTETHQLFVECGCRHMAYEEAIVHWADRNDRVMTRVALAMGKAWYDALPKPIVKKRVVNKKNQNNKKAVVTAKAKAKAKRGKK